MNTSTNLTDLQLYEQNPRRISDEMRARLESSMQEFGDLSGVIRNVREGVDTSGRLLGGNQRTKIFQAEGGECQVVVTDRLDEPNDSGTVAYGYVEFRGERFTYREVDWSDEAVREACVKANLLGGDWNLEILDETFDRFDLAEWGFDMQQFPDDLSPRNTGESSELVDIAQNVDSSEPVNSLNIGGRRIPLTPKEWEKLEQYCDQWSEEHGTYYGIFNSLLQEA